MPKCPGTKCYGSHESPVSKFDYAHCPGCSSHGGDRLDQLTDEERSYIDFYARRSGSGTVQGLLAIIDRLAPAPRPGGSDG